MELLNEKEFYEYVSKNYDLLFEFETPDFSSEYPGKCDNCQRDAFLKIYSKKYSQSYYRADGLPIFVNILIECPKCRRKSFITSVQFAIEKETGKLDEYGVREEKTFYQFYKLFRLPTIEESFANRDIPEEYTSLRETVSEAGFCLAHSKNIAAAILFRRAIQILAKDVLGASGKTLHSQLEWLKSNKNNLGIDLVDVFHDNSRILKDIGNQGAHPDDDETLHKFSKVEADGLHDLFISIVHEVFVKPAKIKALQEELRASRKLKHT